METNIGIWVVTLEDDGTLDTVLFARMRIAPHISYESRFSAEMVERDETGAILNFEELAQDAVNCAEDCRSVEK